MRISGMLSKVYPAKGTTAFAIQINAPCSFGHHLKADACGVARHGFL
jgi:hypothetical protein